MFKPSSDVFRRRQSAMAALTVLSMTLPVLSARAGLAEALDAVSADAQVVVVIPDMRAASDAIADLTAMLGVQEPEMADLLGEFKREMGFEQGLAEDGPAIIVFNDILSAIENETDPSPVLLIPVSDYNAFVGQLGGNGGDGVSAIQFDHEDGHVKSLDGYAVMAEEAATVQAYAAGNQSDALMARVGKYAQDAADESLVAVYIDVATLAPALKPLIDQGVAEFTESFERAQEQGQQMPVPINMVGVMTAYGDLGKVLLDGVDAVMLSAAYDDQGASFDYGLTLVEGSTVAGYLTGNEAAVGDLLNSMPQQPYIFAGAFDGKSLDTVRMNEDLLNAVAEAAGDSALVQGIVEFSKLSMGFSEHMSASASAFYAPDMAAMMTGGFFKSLTVYEVDDPEAALAAYQQSVEALPNMLAGLAEIPDAPAVSFDVTWTPSALNLDGHDVHQYQVNLVLPPEVMQEMGPAAMFLGNAGQGGYITAVGNRIVATTVPDPNLIQQGIRSATEGNGLGTAPTLAAARDHLPEGAIAEMFLSLDGIATAANPFLMMFAGGQQIQIPADLPPVSMGLGLQDRAIGFRTHVPNETMVFVRDTVEQMQAAQQQQQRGGGQRAPF